MPNLAGQPAEYIVNQLRQFQQGSALGGTDGATAVDDEAGTRVHRSMNFNAKRLGAADIEAIGGYYAALPCRDQRDRPRTTGPAPKAAWMCIKCHGENGRARHQAIPNLAAQNYAYLVNQLKAFRETADGTPVVEARDWRRHPVMSKVAGTMDDADIAAIAGYFAGLPCK